MTGLAGRLWYRVGGFLGIADTLIHRAPLRWLVPETVSRRLCARFDRALRNEFNAAREEAK